MSYTSTNQATVTLTGLTAGQHTFQFDVLDTTGDVVLAESTASTWTIDLTPPTVSLNAEPSFLNNTTPTFSGIAGTVAASTTSAADLGSVTVSIYSGSTTSGAPFETLTATVGVGGSYSVAVPTSMALAQGTYTAVASQSDRACNIGYSAATTFTVDTTPPTVSLTPPMGSLNAEPSFLNSSTPTFSGSAGTVLASSSSPPTPAR